MSGLLLEPAPALRPGEPIGQPDRRKFSQPRWDDDRVGRDGPRRQGSYPFSLARQARKQFIYPTHLAATRRLNGFPTGRTHDAVQ